MRRWKRLRRGEGNQQDRHQRGGAESESMAHRVFPQAICGWRQGPRRRLRCASTVERRRRTRSGGIASPRSFSSAFSVIQSRSPCRRLASDRGSSVRFPADTAELAPISRTFVLGFGGVSSRIVRRIVRDPRHASARCIERTALDEQFATESRRANTHPCVCRCLASADPPARGPPGVPTRRRAP